MEVGRFEPASSGEKAISAACAPRAGIAPAPVCGGPAAGGQFCGAGDTLRTESGVLGVSYSVGVLRTEYWVLAPAPTSQLAALPAGFSLAAGPPLLSTVPATHRHVPPRSEVLPCRCCSPSRSSSAPRCCSWCSR